MFEKLPVIIQLTNGPPWLNNFISLGLLGTVLILSTFIYTELSFYFTLLSQSGTRKRPPTLPYWIPFLGHTIWVIRDAHNLYESAAKAHADGITAVRIATMYCYIISGGENIQKVLRSSRVQTMDPVFLEVTRKCFNLPQEDFAILEADTSGHGKIPLTDIPEEKRIMRLGYVVQNTKIKDTGTLDILSRVFNREFQEVMEEQSITNEWRTILLHKFSLNNMSTATERSMMGRSIFKYNPNVTEDFWIFLGGAIKLFMGVPKFLSQDIWDARERLTDAWAQHLENIADKYDRIQDEDPEWEPELGARVNRLRDAVNRDCGISPRGRGALMTGFMIAMQGNTVPVTSWILIELVRDPELFATIRSEVSTALIADPASPEGSDKLAWDIPKLLALPVLSSVFTETLRLRMSNNPNRLLTADLEVGGYLLKAGNQVMLPNWVPHLHDPEWTDNNPSPRDYPPSKFWAGRFLATKEGSAEKTNVRPKPGTYFPFGGGATMCPGRFFARQEILISVAVMVMKYDFEFIEVVDKKGRARKGELDYDRSGAGFGALHPDGDLRCRIRKREH